MNRRRPGAAPGDHAERRASRPGRLGPVLGLAAALLAGLWGCASVPPDDPVPPDDSVPMEDPVPVEETPTTLPAPPGSSEPPETSGSPGSPDSPALPDPSLWTLPGDALGTQRLYRGRYDGAEGEGTVRITLRLESPSRYRLAVADRLGRLALTLTVDGPRGGIPAGLLLDHRQERYCVVEGDLELPGLPFGAFSAAAVPALLTGRLPAPAVRAEVARSGDGPSPGTMVLVDPGGRRWTVEEDGASILSWTLWSDGEPVVWLRTTDGGERLLSDRRRGVQLTWREVLVEPLGEPLAPPRVPPGWLPGLCAPPVPAG